MKNEKEVVGILEWMLDTVPLYRKNGSSRRWNRASMDDNAPMYVHTWIGFRTYLIPLKRQCIVIDGVIKVAHPVLTCTPRISRRRKSRVLPRRVRQLEAEV